LQLYGVENWGVEKSVSQTNGISNKQCLENKGLKTLQRFQNDLCRNINNQ